MPAPLALTFGPWAPDIADVAVMVNGAPVTMPLADCLNVYFQDGKYRSLPTPANNQAGALFLAATPCWAFTALDPGGNPVIQAGTGGALFSFNTSNPAAVAFTQIGTGYTAAQWSFCQFGAQMYATDANPACTDGLLSWGFEISPTVSTVSGAPASNTVATVGQFVMVGDLGAPITGFSLGTGNGSTTTFTATSTNYPIRPTSAPGTAAVTIYNAGVYGGGDLEYGTLQGTALASGSVNYDTGVLSVTFVTPPANGHAITANFVQAFPNRVQWSAIGNAQSWPTPLTNAAIAAQSGYQDNDADLGRVMAIAGYPLYCLIFQKSGIQLAQYVGGNVVFSFGAYERKRGLVARGAMVQVSKNCYFLAEDGFFVTDGANVTPIGTASDNSAGIDNWFWANVNKSALAAISSGYDATLRCVMWAIPTGASTVPTVLLIYNPMSGKWTKAAATCQWIWSDTDGTRHKVGLLSQPAPSDAYYQSLTGTPLQGYLETCDTVPADGSTMYTIGAVPNIDCTDTPLIMIGTRKAQGLNVDYSRYAPPDSFSTMAPFLKHGRYTRGRLASSSATAFNGLTLMQEPGGPF